MTVLPTPPVEMIVRPPRRRFRWLLWLSPVLLIGLFFMLLVPTMCRSPEAANRIKCASNLRQIGLALKLYAETHDGVLPPDWRTLATHADLTADVFVCPSSDLTDRAPGKTPAEWAVRLDDADGRHNCYRYAAAGLKTTGLMPDDVLAFEPHEDHQQDGLNVLFADGHVDWAVSHPDPARRPQYDRLLADHAAGVRPLKLMP